MHLNAIQALDVAGVDLARGKTATHSATFEGNNTKWGAPLVVAGQLIEPGEFGMQHTTVPTSGNGWVEVDLGTPSTVSQVVLSRALIEVSQSIVIVAVVI